MEENGRFGKTRLITNSIGFRDKEIRKINNETSKYRIVFIGGSYTEGFMVNYEDSFVGIIDEKLEKYNIEVLNAGVVGYSPSIYYAKMKYFLNKNFKFDELIVFIDVEDITAEAFTDRLEIAKNFGPSERGKYSVYVAFIKKNLFITYKFLNLISDTINYQNRVDDYNEKKLDEFILGVVSGKTHSKEMWTIDKEIYKTHENGVNKSLKYMKLLSDLCIKNNIKLTIAVFPHMTQIYHNDLDSIQVKIWKKFSLENDINFINYFPHFFNKNLSLEERVMVIKEYFKPFDIHPNNKASKVISDIFLEKFLPSLEN